MIVERYMKPSLVQMFFAIFCALQLEVIIVSSVYHFFSCINIFRKSLLKLVYFYSKCTGCISCFGCKREKFKGHCICRDGLTPVLDAIWEAEALIIGSPNYLSEMTASLHALYERLIF